MAGAVARSEGMTVCLSIRESSVFGSGSIRTSGVESTSLFNGPDFEHHRLGVLRIFLLRCDRREILALAVGPPG